MSLATEPSKSQYDAVIVGSGPNGLAAAITLAEAGRSVVVLEAADQPGGGLRSYACTRPGFVHDHCSAIHAMGVASPFFRRLPLGELGLRWIHPEIPCAHAFADRPFVYAESSFDATCTGLGVDGESYRSLLAPFLDRLDELLEANLGPFRVPSRPVWMGRFGLRALRSATGLAKGQFASDEARGLFAGMAAHSVQALDRPLTAAIGVMLSLTAHDRGWPVAEGGSGRIADALIAHLRSLGGEVVVSRHVRSLGELPGSTAVLFDVAPRALASIAREALPARFRQRLQRYRHGPGAFKIDYALSGPIPWRDSRSAMAGTVHVGGPLEEVAEAERAVWEGRVAERPFLLVAQQSACDPTRAPAGMHTGWVYCHTPHGSTHDHTEAIESQLERFAPGFRDVVLARHVTRPADFARGNPNFVGGDIVGGVLDATQLFTRPVARLNPYTTPNPKLFLCSASTPPGAGVHGMCGVHAAQTALRRILRN